MNNSNVNNQNLNFTETDTNVNTGSSINSNIDTTKLSGEFTNFNTQSFQKINVENNIVVEEIDLSTLIDNQ